MILADRRDRRLRHPELARAARLRAPHVERLELTGDRHRGEDTDPHVQRALEPDEGPEMREPAGQLGAVQEHRERPLERAPALHDRVDGGVVLRRDLALAGDRRQAGHD